MVAAFADVVGVDRDEALAAAGLRPGVTAPAQPTREPDVELDLIMAADVPEDRRRMMIERLYQLRDRDQQRRLDDIRWWIDREEGA